MSRGGRGCGTEASGLLARQLQILRIYPATNCATETVVNSGEVQVSTGQSLVPDVQEFVIVINYPETDRLLFSSSEAQIRDGDNKTSRNDMFQIQWRTSTNICCNVHHSGGGKS